MPSYTVRHLIHWAPRKDQTKKHVYEERITAWNSATIDEAIELAEAESKVYSEEHGFESLDLFQAYWLFDDMGIIPQGSEVFSLLRDSDLEPETYIDTYFDTGEERLTDYFDTHTEHKEEAEQGGDGDAEEAV